jgi:hypothetical protein
MFVYFVVTVILISGLVTGVSPSPSVYVGVLGFTTLCYLGSLVFPILAFGAMANSYSLKDAHLLDEYKCLMMSRAATVNAASASGEHDSERGLASHGGAAQAVAQALAEARQTVLLDGDVFCRRVALVKSSFPLLAQFIVAAVTAVSLSLRLIAGR